MYIPPHLNAALIFGAIIAAIIACVVVVRMARNRRAQELERAAAQAGLSFELLANPFSDLEMTQMLRFTRRRGHLCHHVARGAVAGMDAVFFEHFGRRGNNRESVAAFRVAAPAFELVPLRYAVNPAVMAPVFERLGFVVMTFADFPEFCQHYLLLGRDEAALRRLFTPELRSLFCRDDVPDRWAAESGGGWLLAYRADQRVRPAELKLFLEDAAAVAGAVRHACANAAAG